MAKLLMNPTALLSFHYGDESIQVERFVRHKVTQRILIKVFPNGRVTVAAPVQADDAHILIALQKRARWISKQLEHFRQQSEHVTPRQYISGESHYYLGKQHVLKVIEAPESTPNVKLLRGKLEVTVQRKSAEAVQALLLEWYKARAKEVFAKRLEAMLEQTLWVSERPPLRILSMQTQWGSCSPQGKLILNPYLVKAPRDCIDYVIVHELCHLAEHNHSERFYRLMRQVMPQWQETKAHLDKMANRLLI